MSDEESRKKKRKTFQAVDAEKFSMLQKDDDEDDHVYVQYKILFSILFLPAPNNSLFLVIHNV